MINEYPAFTPITLQHKDVIRKHTSRFEPYSDFNFTSLFCWNTDGSTEVALLNGNLVIKLPDYLTGKTTLSLLGDEKIDESLLSLLERTDTLQLVPEIVIQHIGKQQQFKITEDSDNHDYIYSAADIAHLPGGHYKKKRNKVNSVITDLGGMLTVSHEKSLDSSDKQAFRQLFVAWAKKANTTGSENDSISADSKAEQTAIGNLLDNADGLNLYFTSVAVDGVLSAFSINELLDSDYAICHFEKALPVHEQIYTFISNAAAKNLYEKGCRLINWEQDLGIPGLRKSKLAFGPVKYLKKYTLSRNEA